ncbi:MAG TPA: CDGSH iron-sulfur domain-containing protein [Candidatus Nanopelagicaceae bacterium]
MTDHLKMQVKANGSIRVTGTVDFVDAEGNILKTETDFSLCRCGHSENKPFCDGSHRKNNFEAPAL